MSTDLSHLAQNSLWVTSQLSGGRPADSSAAFAPPGSPSLGADQVDVDQQPFTVPIVHERTVLEDGNDTGLDGGRPVLRTGGWNDMGGGPAPEGYRHA